MSRRPSHRRVRPRNLLADLIAEVFFESDARRRRRKREIAVQEVLKATSNRNDQLHADSKSPPCLELIDSEQMVHKPSLGGIDDDIRSIFLTLPPGKLAKVFQRYGQLYGTSKLIYAKSTYADWRSGHTKMSGIVVARLLNLVPSVIDSDTRFLLVQKLRQANFRKQHIEIDCNTANWFKKVPLVINDLIDYSNRFEWPQEFIEKLDWLSNGDAVAAQDLLAAAEVDEAKARTAYLEGEYSIIRDMLCEMDGEASVNHIIELPQGTVEVTITKLKLSMLQRLPLSPVNEQRKKRRLAVVCKNPACRVEFETKFSVYDGEPINFRQGELTCGICGATRPYDNRDLRRERKVLNIEIVSGLFGRRLISYDCPHCSTRLKSPLKEAGNTDNCPKCQNQFIVPSQ